MVGLLLKKQLQEIFRGYFYDNKNNRARAKVSTILLFVMYGVIMIGLLGGMFTGMASVIARPLSDAGVGWLYFDLMGAVAILLGLFGSVFSTYSGLYLSKDNDFLFSMPIPASAIMISRLMSVYLMGLLYSVIVTLPAVIVYAVLVEMTPVTLLCGLMYILLISVIIMLLSCLLGWVVARVSLRLKHKSFVTVVLSLTFIGLYYFLYFKAVDVIEELLSNAAIYGAAVKDHVYAMYVFGHMGEGGHIETLIVTVFTVAFGALVWLIMKKTFFSISTDTGVVKKTQYREKMARQRSIMSVLLFKEIKRFTSSATYMLNCGLGIIMMPLAGIFLLVAGREFIAVLETVFTGDGIVSILLTIMLFAIIAMNDIATPSVSLEGSSLWILQSLPVTARQVLGAKFMLQFVFTAVPAVFTMLCVVIIYPEAWLLIPVGLTFIALICAFDLMLGLLMPNLNWTSELAPIKKSISVLIALFGGWVYAAVFIVIYFLVAWPMGYTLYMIMYTLINLILASLLGLWIKYRGAVIFTDL